MKAYVIKNKEEKFWQFLYYHKSEFVDDICNAFFHYSKQDAERSIYFWELKDCEVVEVTIAEIDENLLPQNYNSLSIEDKLKFKENQVRIARDRDVEYSNKITELEFTIKRLEEELAEKNKQIEKLTRRLNLTTKYKDDQKEIANKYYNKLKQVRKRICDEIREKAHYYMEIPICEKCAKGFYDSIMTSYDLKALLDQIEKEEEK